MRNIFFAALIALSAGTSNAAVMGVDSTPFDGANRPAGFVANDLTVDFTGQLATQQLRVVLTQGSIYQNSNGGDTAPSDAFVGFVPELEFDTFVTMGSARSDTSEDVLIAGGAVNIGGEPGTTFDENGIDITFAPGTGIVVDGGVDYLIGRITLSDDAEGEVWVYSQTLGEDPLLAIPGGNFPIGNVAGGVISFIPEPSTAMLAGLALVGFVARRK